MTTENPADPLHAFMNQFEHADPQLKNLLEQQLRNNMARKDDGNSDETIRRLKIQNNPNPSPLKFKSIWKK